MLINIDREPKYSLYYIGAIIMKRLKKEKSMYIEEIYLDIKSDLNDEINIDFIYYSLDWLYALSLITVERDKVIIC